VYLSEWNSLTDPFFCLTAHPVQSQNCAFRGIQLDLEEVRLFAHLIKLLAPTLKLLSYKIIDEPHSGHL